ncbi:hypothetical protein [Robiginitalea sp. IMCC43444]|uniref:hypothetical protein n=1 Tax=Robiginitalea sp. IMCC43444 TaxID=3459121 RepID=UPI004042103B
MNRLITIVLWVILIPVSLALLIALLDLWPEGPLGEYRIHLVVVFIALGVFMRKRLKKQSR